MLRLKKIKSFGYAADMLFIGIALGFIGILGIRYIKRIRGLKYIKKLTACEYTRTEILGELQPLKGMNGYVVLKEINKESFQYIYCLQTGDTSVILASDSKYTDIVYTADRNELEVTDKYNKNGKLVEQHVTLYICTENRLCIDSTEVSYNVQNYLGGKLSYTDLKALAGSDIAYIGEIGLGDVITYSAHSWGAKYVHLWDMLYTDDIQRIY